MAQVKPDKSVGSVDWVNINTLVSVDVGNPFVIYNKSSRWITVAESATKPDVNARDGVPLSPMSHGYAKVSISAGSLTIWGICDTKGKTGMINVQEV